MKKFFCYLAIFLMFVFSGCFSNSQDSFQHEKKNTKPEASLRFQIDFPTDNVHDNKIKTSTKIEAEVAFHLKLFNFENQSWQSTEIRKSCKIVNGKASVNFTNLSCEAAILKANFINCSLEGYNYFHGACDLNEGDNLIILVPVGSGMQQDLEIEVFNIIVDQKIGRTNLNNCIFSKIKPHVSNNLEAGDPVTAAFDSFYKEFNQENHVDITSPGPNSPFTGQPGDSLVIELDLSGFNKEISKVEFFDNGLLIGTTIGPPYNFKLDNISEDIHIFSALVHDTAGETFETNEVWQPVIDEWIITDQATSSKNLALGKNTWSNSQEFSYDSSKNVVDGDNNTRWSSNRNDPGPSKNYPHRVIVDLNNIFQLEAIKVELSSWDNWKQNFTIYGSNDLYRWQQIAHKENETGSFIFNNDISPARYLLFQSYYSEDNGQVNVYEISAYDEPYQEPQEPEIPEAPPLIEIKFATNINIPLVPGESFTVIASFTDVNQNLSQVDFFINETTIESVTINEPIKTLNFEYIPVNPGKLQIYCAAVDKADNRSISSPLNLEIKQGFLLPENQPYELIFSNLNLPLLSEELAYSVASLTTPEALQTNLSSMKSIRANKEEKSKPQPAYDLDIKRTKNEWALPGIEPTKVNKRASLRYSSLAELEIMGIKEFNIEHQLLEAYDRRDFYKLAQNEECIVFGMESNLIGTPCISQSQGESIADFFGKANPLHPQQKSIVQVDREVFGTEWQADGGRDGESRIIILVFNSDYAPVGLHGYFRPVDQLYPAGGYETYYSNGGEIIYINETVLTSQSETISTLAHEFQHCIFLNQSKIRDGDFINRETSLFLNEGCAMLASELNYVDYSQMTDYTAKALAEALDFFMLFGLTDFDGYMLDYGKAYLFVKYIYEKSGKTQLQKLITETPGLFSAQLSANKTNNEFLADWHTALRLSGKTDKLPAICYDDFDLFRTVTSRAGNDYNLAGAVTSVYRPSELKIKPICAPGVSRNLSIGTNNEQHQGKVYIDFIEDNLTIKALIFDTNGNFVKSKIIKN